MNQEIYDLVKAHFVLGLDYGVAKNKLKKIGEDRHKNYFAPIAAEEEKWIEQDNFAQLMREMQSVEMVNFNYPKEVSCIKGRDDLEFIQQQNNHLMQTKLTDIADDLKDPQSLQIILEMLHLVIKEEIEAINKVFINPQYAINATEFIARIEGIHNFVKIRQMLDDEVFFSVAKQTQFYLEKKIEFAEQIEDKKIKAELIKSYQTQLKGLAKAKNLVQLVKARAPLEISAIKNYASYALKHYIEEHSTGLTNSQKKERLQVANGFAKKILAKEINSLYAVLVNYSIYIKNVQC